MNTSKKNELYYCPICGSINNKSRITNHPEEKICYFCGGIMLTSGIDNTDILTSLGITYSDTNWKSARDSYIYDKYLYNSPTYDNTLFRKRLLETRKAIISSQKEIEQIKNHQHEREESNKVRCPRCGSTQIQMVQRKWSWITGFMTNKVDRVCMNCKHKW